MKTKVKFDYLATVNPIENAEKFVYRKVTNVMRRGGKMGMFQVRHMKLCNVM